MTETDKFNEEVYQVVRDIPADKVITYGEIARLLGTPQYSRRVGRAMKLSPGTPYVPCHRVVNSQGRLAPGWKEQRSLLEEEGVPFKKNSRVDMARCSYMKETESF
ncbi:MAG: methylated-DNA--[protein]-cysteine S-methyltransferase [Bacteroides sp.]|nr:methylated-DNA--[protein]-cysteine S-methyltransferase [Bacteroides sp.]